ncbi:MAG: polyisoprenoid-binding protein [Candidatus Binatia bacterium]|nr:MAG: polyisoprenoid-binding protein [Candidatus Binatia bacterium]
MMDDRKPHEQKKLLRPALRVLPTLALLFLLAAPSAATTYKVDPDHTSVTFRVRHLFTKVQGRFDRFEGKIVFDPSEPRKARVEGWIDVASVNTNVEERDKDLRSARFFDAAKYPKIEFRSTRVLEVAKDGKHGKLEGQLTIHGVTRPVVLDVAYLGEATDPWGNKRAGFSAKTTIDRKDFGLTWNEVLETGGVLVGEEVEIEIQAEGLVEE